MQVKTVKISELRPHPKNPRVHPDSAIEKLVRSIKEFGWTNPILVSADGYILAGHARLKAAEKAGIEEVPVIYLPLEGAKAEAYLIADNRLQDETDWDLPKLKDLLLELDTGEFDLELTGFDMDEIEDLMTQFHVPEEIIEDVVPEPPEEPITKPGDLWILGRHRLLCGDATKKEDVEKLMNGVKADMVLTDPPYGMHLDTDFSSIKGSMKSIGRKNHTQGNKYNKVIGDNEDFTPKLITTIFNNFGYCKEMFLFGADYYAELLPNKNDGSWLVWDKRKESQADAIGSEFELCWSKQKHKRRILRHDWFGFLSSENSYDARHRVHPTQKPITLFVDIINQWGKSAKVIVDIYGGSGSTLIACEQLNRTCYMMEIDPVYCDVIVQRYINLKGHDGDVYLERDGNKIAFSNVT